MTGPNTPASRKVEIALRLQANAESVLATLLESMERHQWPAVARHMMLKAVAIAAESHAKGFKP